MKKYKTILADPPWKYGQGWQPNTGDDRLNCRRDIERQTEELSKLLKSEKEKLLERIKLKEKKVGNEAYFELKKRYSGEKAWKQLSKRIGYNQAIADLEKLKEEIRNE